MEKTRFQDMNISPEIKRAIEDVGYISVTEIQAESIPTIMAGEDVIGHSQTGTGKTAAFGIPAIEKVIPDVRRAQILILCPTRELALQATDEIRKFAKYKQGIKTVCIYGGQPIDRQILSLKTGPQIVVGTPGRVMDHMRRRTLRFGNVSMVVLDEADEMLNMGFREDIETILSKVPNEKQMVLFSATISKEILQITKKYQNNPRLIKVVPEEKTVPNVEQFYYEVAQSKKLDALTRLIDMEDVRLAMVFCNTKKQVDELVLSLKEKGYMADGLHGDMRQPLRLKVLNEFKQGIINILVATDVAARGIDINNVDAVFNYDIPIDPEYYVHRIGRTARAGKSGTSHTIATSRKQLSLLKMIQNYTHAQIIQKAVPAAQKVRENKIERLLDRAKACVREEDISAYLPFVRSAAKEYGEENIAAALLKIYLPKEDGLENKNSVRLKFSIGKNAKICPKHIVGAVAELCNISGKDIGSIDIYTDYTMVEIPTEYRQLVLRKMQNKRINGKTITVTDENWG